MKDHYSYALNLSSLENKGSRLTNAGRVTINAKKKCLMLGPKCKIFTCQILHIFAGIVARIKHRTKDGTPRTQHGGQYRIEESGLRTED